MKRVYTVLYVENEHRILLGLKKRSLGQGWWNGFGGKVESGETIEQAAIRETEEEAGIRVRNIRSRGAITFHFPDGAALEVHYFSTQEHEGTPVETAEMQPRWFSKKDLPYNQMWPSDSIWMPLFLAGKDLSGDCWFDENKQITRHTIRTL